MRGSDSMEFLMQWGVPSAITGLLVWLLKKHIDNRDKQIKAREDNVEKLMFMIVKTSEATNILAEATAKAVQRIPEAHCNGDMTSALKRASDIRKESQQFLISNGVKHIFED